MNNYFFLVISILTLLILYKILWLKNFHNSFFWGLCFQWLGVNIKVIYSIIIDKDFVYLHSFPDHIIRAWVYSNITLTCVAIGIRLSMKQKKFNDFNNLISDKLNVDKFANYYILISILTFTVFNPRFYPGAFTQILIQFVYIKYVFFFIGFSILIRKKQYNNKLFYYLIFEFILSFTGFFSDFKDFFFIVFISLAFANSKKIKFNTIIFASILVSIFFFIGVVWTVVKGDYRDFLNRGTSKQEVSRGTGESLNFLYNKVSEVNNDKLIIGVDALISRIEYIDFFSACLGYVPLQQPHENGKILLNAAQFAIMPRLLFPNKEVLDDSKFTHKYTGVSVAGSDEGTSICLGYAANSYVDFGDYFFISPLILGLMIGIMNNILYKSANNELLGLAITFPIYFAIYSFGYEYYKIIPPLFFYFFIAILFLKYGNKVFKIDFRTLT